MYRHFSCTLFVALLAPTVPAQGPTVTSWIINPGAETGYGGYLSNVQTVHYSATDVYVACTCIPGYDVGPWAGNPNTPANQDFVFKITRNPVGNTGTLLATGLGHIGVWRNGVSIFNAKDGMSYNNQGIWNRDALVWEGSSFDVCLGHPAPNGEYHHHVSPNCLYDHLDDETHSELIGYAFDGFPIYGAYGFVNADGSGGITRMRSSYRLRDITERTTLPNGTVLNAGQYGPAIGGQYPLGAFIEDYEYVAGLGDLDVHNGRFCTTPEYPAGTYAYFVTLSDEYEPAYPYTIGPTYYGTVQPGNTGPQSGHNTVPGSAVLYDPLVMGTTDPTQSGVRIFPIPAHANVCVQAPGRRITRMSLLDGLGRIAVVTRPNHDQGTIDVSGLVPGMYTARIAFADGAVVQRPLIKE